jgi:hypothetical protein
MSKPSAKALPSNSLRCECCALVYHKDRMSDEFVCRYCLESADRGEISKDFQRKSSRFSRYLPENLRETVFAAADETGSVSIALSILQTRLTTFSRTRFYQTIARTTS